jgi:hypothetical protein
MSNPQSAVAEFQEEPVSKREPEEMSPDLQKVLDAMAEVSRNPLPRSRIHESAFGYWTVKPIR